VAATYTGRMALTREQAIAWTARWRALGAAAAAAADRSPEERLRTLGRLRSFALAAGRMREGGDEQIVRERFQALRERLGRGRRRP
jgi:hypothetical protein